MTPAAAMRRMNRAFIHAVPMFAKRPFYAVRERLRHWQAERAVARFRRPAAKPHGLSRELVVTLTSYPARYPILHKTLRSLLLQSVRADRIVLWIAGKPSDLPQQVQDLQALGLEIRTCDELRSYKKIIPALEAFPAAYLVTADDDLYYESRWLETIVEGAADDPTVIVCRRAHRPRRQGSGFAPYSTWEHDIVTDGAAEACLFPTSGAGALFPPGSLAPEVTDRHRFLSLCPYADDVWLFVMARRVGSRFRQVGGGFSQVCWAGSQSTSLMQHNLEGGGNDTQLAAVLGHFEHTPQTG